MIDEFNVCKHGMEYNDCPLCKHIKSKAYLRIEKLLKDKRYK